jgi:1-acyl-sn-glycerol-3-phosphate acyltransferase
VRPRAGGRKRDPVAIARAAAFVDRVLVPYHRVRVTGLERIPDGPALFVANHSGGFYSGDTYLFGAAVLRARGLAHVPYALAHDLVVGFGPLARWLVPLGAVRADTATAAALLAGGAKVLAYPGGDADGARAFRDRNRIRFDGATGYARLALACDVPVVPVVAAGAHSTAVVLADGAAVARLLRTRRWLRLRRWPLLLSVPWGLTFLPSVPYLPLPARITIEVGDPIRFDPSGPAAARDPDHVRACADRVEAVMQATLDRLTAR